MNISKKPTQFTLLIIASLLYIPNGSAEISSQEIVIVDGREVVLNDDGTWQLLSTDRFANRNDGTRVRLKEDGSWQTIGNAQLISKQQVRTADLDISLQKVVIETYEKKVQKNTRVKTQTVFYVDIVTSPQAKTSITIKESDLSLIEIKDNNAKSYPVISIQPHDIQLKPNSKITLIVRADKSPSIFDSVKSMEIIFKKGIFGIDSPIAFNQRTIDFISKKVDGFE